MLDKEAADKLNEARKTYIRKVQMKIVQDIVETESFINNDFTKRAKEGIELIGFKEAETEYIKAYVNYLCSAALVEATPSKLDPDRFDIKITLKEDA